MDSTLRHGSREECATGLPVVLWSRSGEVGRHPLESAHVTYECAACTVRWEATDTASDPLWLADQPALDVRAARLQHTDGRCRRPSNCMNLQIDSDGETRLEVPGHVTSDTNPL